MSEPSFDLTTEPWIRVRTLVGDLEEVSLREVFTRAHELVAIAGELPTQDDALLRLLLAILRRAHQDKRGTEAWGALWRRGRFDPEPISAYLDRFADRFDLLHPTTPFYQVAGLATAKGTMTELARLVADVPPGFPYFTTRTAAALDSMSFAETARWLVHCQAFDPSGIKSGAVGDERVKGGRGYPIGVSWCGWLGLVVVEGRSLFETLLLNLPIARRDSDPARDLPAWERPPLTAAVEAGHATPAGPADLLTWQSRRVRVAHDGVRATGVLIANGDPLHPRNRFGEEFMTSWRLSEAQMKQLGTKDQVFMPRGHQPDRAVWRGLEGLLVEGDAAGIGKTGRWLDWLAELQDDEELAHDAPVRMRAIGMHYGSQSSVTDDICDDVLPVSVDVLGSQHLRALAVDAVKDIDVAVRALGTLTAELAEAAGASGDIPTSARSAARELGYASLDQPYRAWLRDLRSDTDRSEARPLWQQSVYEAVITLAQQMLRNASPLAWVGREVIRGTGTGAKTIYLDAATAESRFYRDLRTAFGPALALRVEGANA